MEVLEISDSRSRPSSAAISETSTGAIPSSLAESDSSPRRITWQRAVCVLTFVCLGFLLQGASYSHLTAFFDLYGLEEKGLSSTEYGVIMGSYCLVMVIVSPLTAKLVSLKFFSDKTLMLLAWTIDATFGLILSFAYKLERGSMFFVGCLFLRILEATGCAIGFIMPYVITGAEMNEYNHIIIPLLETIYGASVVAGPAISGVLYDLGGFPMPFRALGATLMCLMILAIVFFPKAREPPQKELATEDDSLWAVWDSSVFVNILCTVSAFVLLSSNESTLALQLSIKFGMNATESGLLFLYPGGCYALTSLLLGYLSKRISDPRLFVLGGQLLSLLAVVLQGPLIPIKQTKTIFILSQILLGAGAGPSLVCAYLQSLRYLTQGKESKEMHAALSAVFIPASLVGSTVGPLAAGIIRHYYAYDGVMAANAIQIGLIAILLFSTICATSRNAKFSVKPQGS